MEIGVLAFLFISGVVLVKIFWKKDIDKANQKALNRYLNQPQSKYDLGRAYERYIGYLHEIKGDAVKYNGVIDGHSDLGRDLIVWHKDEVRIIQTKYWSRYKTIHEKHILQLYGSMVHWRLTNRTKKPTIKAFFYTTATYSKATRAVARVLGIELRRKYFNRAYPKIKCIYDIKNCKNKIYVLPFDERYDRINVNTRNGDFYAHTIEEAVKQGFSYYLKIREAA